MLLDDLQNELRRLTDAIRVKDQRLFNILPRPEVHALKAVELDRATCERMIFYLRCALNQTR